MSQNDIKLVEETLKGLMIPDNNIRREAEVKLEGLMTNKGGLVFCLSNIILCKLKNLIQNSIARGKCKIIRRCSNEKTIRNKRRRNCQSCMEINGVTS
jgi:hypothetical protein